MKGFIFVIVMFLMWILLPQGIYATTAETVNRQISDINAQIQALDKEIAQYQQQVTQTSSEAKTLANLVKELTLTRNKLLTETKVTEKKINATNLVIGEINNTISEEQQSINNSKEVLGKIFRDLYQQDSYSLIQKLLSEENLIEASRKYNDLLSINESVTGHVETLEEQKKLLLKSKEERELEQKKLNDLKTILQQKKLVVDITKKDKDALLNETKNKELNYRKLLADREKQKDAFEKSLQEYEAQLKFILNPKSLPSKGALAWPLDSVRVTSSFGTRWGRFHYGTDFRASVGTPVKAMAGGVVLGTGDTDLSCKGASFGKWIFIKYNNGLSSTYGHLSAISANVGQVVAAGDIVGLSGNTGSSTGPHLHVGVYASDGVNVDTVPSKSCNGKIFTQPIAALSAYLDPMLYLPKL